METELKLFLDIDGVLIGKRNNRPVLAKGATEFLEYVINISTVTG